MLDVAGTELNPLGYNHDLFKGVISSKEVDNSIINNFAADAGASANFAASVKESLASVAPKGMNGVALSNMKNATGEAVAHAMIERSEEWSGMSALYFQGSTHGSPLTLGGMICGFPSASYPASKSDESSILEQVRNTVAEKRSNNTPVAAIVIEPTQYSTGYVASEEFIGSLKSIASEFEAALIVDETATGCGASGKGFW